MEWLRIASQDARSDKLLLCESYLWQCIQELQQRIHECMRTGVLQPHRRRSLWGIETNDDDIQAQTKQTSNKNNKVNASEASKREHNLVLIGTSSHIDGMIRACMHAYIHTYIHAYIHKYIHTYIQRRVLERVHLVSATSALVTRVNCGYRRQGPHRRDQRTVITILYMHASENVQGMSMVCMHATHMWILMDVAFTDARLSTEINSFSG
jgi:hypothetical protein